MRTEELPLHKILLPPRLHRVSIDEDALYELMQSIQANGLINPITVSETNGAYQLEAGHRRYLAHQRLQRTTIRATIYTPGEPFNGSAVRFAENLARADLSPMEEAKAIAEHITDTGATPEQVASMVHRRPEWVEQRLALLALPDELTIELHAGRLGIAHALTLARVGDAAHRAYLLRYTLDAGATIATVRDWCRQWELARDAGNADGAPRPELPIPGEPVVILVPCYICGSPHPYQVLRILRACGTCAQAIAGAAIPAPARDPLNDEPRPIDIGTPPRSDLIT